MRNYVLRILFLVIAGLIRLSSFELVFSARTYRRRQAISCSFAGSSYRLGERWQFEVGTKVFHCKCKARGRPHCEWRTNPTAQTQCHDSATRTYRAEGERFERSHGNKTLDCECARNPDTRRHYIQCSGERRCHQNGVSHLQGGTWTNRDITGVVMSCTCLGNERVSCTGSVTRDVPRPVADAQWVEDHIVYGQQILRPRIATLQACDTGNRVVSSGFTWNETAQVTDTVLTVKRCICKDALISCNDFRVSRNQEPHCLSDDGRVYLVGEHWTHFHQDHPNLRWRCMCRAHGEKDCQDAGYCPDPSPPSNGAMVCVAAGKAGRDQNQYCKPLCRQGYDFLNPQRRYRLWEVCGRVTYHRWSGGYVEDALQLAKCVRSTGNPRGRPSLYFPGECEIMSERMKEQIQLTFIRTLNRDGLCRNKCQVKWFRCGDQTAA